MTPLARCRRCNRVEYRHCQFDEPGVDHAIGCVLMHHEFRLLVPKCAKCKEPRENTAHDAECYGCDVGVPHGHHTFIEVKP